MELVDTPGLSPDVVRHGSSSLPTPTKLMFQVIAMSELNEDSSPVEPSIQPLTILLEPTPHLRVNRTYGMDVLEQLWHDKFSGTSEWKRVPVVVNGEPTDKV